MENRIRFQNSLVFRAIFLSVLSGFVMTLIALVVLYFVQGAVLEKQLVKIGYSVLDNYVEHSRESISKGQRETFQDVLNSIAKLDNVKSTALYSRHKLMVYHSGEVTVGKPFTYDRKTGIIANPNIQLYQESRGRYLREDWNLRDLDKTDMAKKHQDEMEVKGLKCPDCHMALPPDIRFNEQHRTHYENDREVSFVYEMLVERDCIICHTQWKQGEYAGALEVKIDKSLVQSQKWNTVFENLMVIAVVTLPVALIIMIILRITLQNPLTKLTSNFEDLTQGDGDLTRYLDEKSKSEMGLVGRLFNRFVKKLAQILGNIRDQIAELEQSSQELDHQSKDIHNKTIEINNKLGTIASASEQITANVVSVAGSTEQASSNVQQVANSIETLNQSIKKVALNA
ncbi:MAG: methyl-accepting chemotaxis protein, partial [SAR324 cluster bacterium]|nr:methyl-accepting chemotaxis protein [SAR324 cluster bacterium]